MSPIAPFLAPERDDLLPVGRMKPSGGSTPYTLPGCGGRVVEGTLGPAANFDYYFAWYTPSSLVIDQLAVEVTTLHAANNCRIGFYKADRDYQPVGAPLADSGDISVASTGVKTYTPASPVAIPRGRYVSVLNSTGGVVSFRAWRPQGGIVPIAITSALGPSSQLAIARVSRTYAAFPTPGTPWDSATYASSTGLDYVIAYRLTRA